MYQLDFICSRIYEYMDPYNTGALFLDNIPNLTNSLDHYTAKLVTEVLENYIESENKFVVFKDEFLALAMKFLKSTSTTDMRFKQTPSVYLNIKELHDDDYQKENWIYHTEDATDNRKRSQSFALNTSNISRRSYSANKQTNTPFNFVNRDKLINIRKKQLMYSNSMR